MEGIKLVNIDLSGVGKIAQSQKIFEEEMEFMKALNEYVDNKTIENKNHVIEEFYDRIQAPLGLLNMYGITAEEVMQGYPKHLEKMHFRPRKKECIKCGYKKNCCLYNSADWQGNQEAENCESYYDEVR